MKHVFILIALLSLLLISKTWARTSAVPPPPKSIEEVAVELADKTAIERLILLSYWRREHNLNSYCNKKLDELYLDNSNLFEKYASLSKGNSFVVRAVCFEFLRRHRNYRVDLPLDDKQLLKPITSYDDGLLEFRKEWTAYRIEKAIDPHDMFDKIKASEPQNARFIDELALIPMLKKGDINKVDQPSIDSASVFTLSKFRYSFIIVAFVVMAILLCAFRKFRI